MTNPSIPNDAIRIGDAEREEMTQRLAKANALGQLTLDEFDERVVQVHAARTRGELKVVAADLPQERTESRGSHSSSSESGSRPSRHHRGRHPFRGPSGERPPWIMIALMVLAIWFVAKIVVGVLFWGPGPGIFPLVVLGGVIYMVMRHRNRTR